MLAGTGDRVREGIARRPGGHGHAATAHRHQLEQIAAALVNLPRGDLRAQRVSEAAVFLQVMHGGLSRSVLALRQ